MIGKTIAIMPAYNEVPNYYIPVSLDNVVYVLLRAKDRVIQEVIAVNDGSTDFTAPRLAEYKQEGLCLLHHSTNLGKLPAVFTALKQAKKEGAEIILTVDADMNNLDNEAISALLHPLRQFRVDMVVADYSQGNRRCGYDFSGFRAMRMSVFDPWFNAHPDFNKWAAILNDTKREACDYPAYDFGDRKKITTGYSLETCLEAMRRLYNLNTVHLPDSGLVSRKAGAGPCTMGEIDFGIAYAIYSLQELFGAKVNFA